MSNQVKIRAALQKRLKTFADGKSLKVLWENDSALSTADTHLRVMLFPSPTRDPSIGAIHKRYGGILRVLVYSATLGKGPVAATTLAEEIVDLFPRGLQIEESGVNVQIDNTPNQSSLMIDGNFVVVEVEVFYRAEFITN
jgi:hypothetical protein